MRFVTRMQQNDRAPLISVLMGVYFQKKDIQILNRSICSILAQSFSDFELLICADGSTGEAKQLMETLAQGDPRIRLLPYAERYDLPVKLNACFRQSRGRLIARMDDDDVSHMDRFEKQVRFLYDSPEVASVGCNVALFQNGRRVGMRRLPEYPGIKDFLFVQPFIHPAMMFRREVLHAVGGYSEDRHCIKCEDYDLLLRLYEREYCGANLQECLLDYTVSASGNRGMGDRWNETVTRWRHFQKLRLLPEALPYVIKPVAVGLLPPAILKKLKDMDR